MGIVYVLLPVSLLLAAAFVLSFRWAARGGQFDELDTEASRILFDDDRGVQATEATKDTHGPRASNAQPDTPTRRWVSGKQPKRDTGR